MKRVWVIVASAVLAVVVLLKVATTAPVIHRLIFMPRPLPEELRDPARWRLEAEEVWIATAGDRRLHGWWIPARGVAEPAPCGIVVVLNGNAGNIANRAPFGDSLSRRGHDVLLFDYGGYGASEGHPSEAGLHADAGAAYRFVMEEKRVPEDRVVLVAHSLGTAVATSLARSVEVGAVVLVAPFTSLPDAARAKLRAVPRWLFDWQEGRFESLDNLGGIRAPMRTLIVAGLTLLLLPHQTFGQPRGQAGIRWTATAAVPPHVVAGVVVDAATGTPLEGAMVRLVPAGYGTVTGEAGLFRFDAPVTGLHELHIELLGYDGATAEIHLGTGGGVAAAATLTARRIPLCGLTVCEAPCTAVRVHVFDVLTGRAPNARVVLRVSGAESTDSVTVVPKPDADVLIIWAGDQLPDPGPYQVEVGAAGYTPWVQRGVERDECGLILPHHVAWLLPARLDVSR